MHKPTAAGKSSYDLIDPENLFSALPLATGMTVLDLACGQGDYALELAGRVGDEGRVHAVDLWPDGIEQLRSRVRSRGLSNILPLVADASKTLPIAEASVDLCLMATVLHDFLRDGSQDEVLREVRRLLKPQGVLAVVEFQKIDSEPGPPKEIRLAPEETAGIVERHGFVPGRTLEVGQYLYLSLYTR